jgi:hypothetical protein
MAKYNWEIVKREFTRGIRLENGTKHYPTLQELSETHEIPRGTIDSTASRKKWQGEKDRYLAKVQDKVDEEKSKIEAEEIVEDDLLCESFGRKALRVADKKLDNIENRLDNDGHVSGKELSDTVNSGGTAQDIIKKAQGVVINKVEVVGLNVHEKIKERAEQYEQLNTETDGND